MSSRLIRRRHRQSVNDASKPVLMRMMVHSLSRLFAPFTLRLCLIYVVVKGSPWTFCVVSILDVCSNFRLVESFCQLYLFSYVVLRIRGVVFHYWMLLHSVFFNK
jgi:hypothetical protein